MALLLGHTRTNGAHLKLRSDIQNRYIIFNGLRSSTKTGVVERFRENGPQESKYAPTPQMVGGEVASYNP